MKLAWNEIHELDCIAGLKQLPPGSVDLAFADPPFNIGYEYDVYDDRRQAEDYLGWCRKWLQGVHRVLTPTGSFWLAIGDEFAAELKVMAQREVGFRCRSWIIWYYTFGVNCVRGFSRSHTHLLYFVKDPVNFTFNADNPTVRVPSARQLVYADGRANPKGRLPDNTWILRPQDASGGFAPDHDTWYFPRVAGTFKEREGFHGCQMPEQLLGRIIRSCSHPRDTVLDPFTGSGTTLAVAKKLGRQWIGFELSPEYARRARDRLAAARVGNALDGAEDPLTSVPTTKGGKRLGTRRRRTRRRLGQASQDDSSDALHRAITAAYLAVPGGYSADHVLTNPDLHASFADHCHKQKAAGSVVNWNRTLLKLRKQGQLPRRPTMQRRTLSFRQMDPYWPGSEIALQQLRVDCELTVDEILADPHWLKKFDHIAAEFAPGYSQFEYRWAALSVRKRARLWRSHAAERYGEWLERELPRAVSLAGAAWRECEGPGAFVLANRDGQPLYVGTTYQLRQRLEQLLATPAWQRLGLGSVQLLPWATPPFGLTALLIRRLEPLLNCTLLSADCGSKVAASN